MIDNFDLIKDLLDFRSNDDFYFVQILKRKKDNGNEKVNGRNNNSRIVKTYYIESKDHLEFVKPEIIELCKIFNARAGINLNRRSFEKLAYQQLKKTTDMIINREFHKIHRAYNTVCGQHSYESDKRWILDVDNKDEDMREITNFIADYCKPEGPKFISMIPSMSGYHLIVKPFDPREFFHRYKDVEIHKNNPTNLYIPDFE